MLIFLMSESHLYQLKKGGLYLYQLKKEKPLTRRTAIGWEKNFSLVMAFQNFCKSQYAVNWWPPDHFGWIMNGTNDIKETEMNQRISVMSVEASFRWMPLLRWCQ